MTPVIPLLLQMWSEWLELFRERIPLLLQMWSEWLEIFRERFPLTLQIWSKWLEIFRERVPLRGPLRECGPSDLKFWEDVLLVEFRLICEKDNYWRILLTLFQRETFQEVWKHFLFNFGQSLPTDFCKPCANNLKLKNVPRYWYLLGGKKYATVMSII